MARTAKHCAASAEAVRRVGVFYHLLPCADVVEAARVMSWFAGAPIGRPLDQVRTRPGGLIAHVARIGFFDLLDDLAQVVGLRGLKRRKLFI